jgi:murein DD-endopeptidase MepM/ murein hydrolase activator NlpD
VKEFIRSARFGLLLLSAIIFSALCGCIPSTISGNQHGGDPGRLPIRPAPGKITHTIRSGETLYSIAVRYDVQWQQIVLANPWLVADDLTPGDLIVIPKGGKRADPFVPIPKQSENDPGRVGPGTEPQPPITASRGHAGPLPAERNFIWPMRGKSLSRYGQPVSWRRWEPNRGLDMRANAGDVIKAAKSGRVNTFDRVPGYGRCVLLEHSDGTMTFYGYVDRFVVPHGRWVKQGEPVALVGATQLSNGTQLHFRVLRGGRFVNPARVLP